MKVNPSALGFIPITAIAKAVKEDRLCVCSLNGRRVGYLLSGPIRKGRDVSVYQICVEEKHRGTGVGHVLFNDLRNRAKSAGSKGIRLRCAKDLPANRFWRS